MRRMRLATLFLMAMITACGNDSKKDSTQAPSVQPEASLDKRVMGSWSRASEDIPDNTTTILNARHRRVTEVLRIESGKITKTVTCRYYLQYEGEKNEDGTLVASVSSPIDMASNFNSFKVLEEKGDQKSGAHGRNCEAKLAGGAEYSVSYPGVYVSPLEIRLTNIRSGDAANYQKIAD